MAKKFRIIFFVILSLNLFLWLNSNLESAESEGTAAYQEVARLIVGETRVFPTRRPSRVAIGNPQIADIVNVTDAEIIVSAKSPGSTTLFYWDVFGEQSFKIMVFTEDLPELKTRIDSLLKTLDLPEVYTKLAEEENKIILLGRVKNPQDRERITVALGPLKDKTVDLIILKEDETVIEIDVQLLELDKDATDTLGLTNPLSTTSGITLTEVGSPGIAAAGTRWSTLFKVSNLRHDAFAWTLFALVQQGKARVLSRPRLACQSGKEAKLLVGGEVPIFTATVSSTGVTTGTVEYKEYGIILNIRPQVVEAQEAQRIHINLGVEVSELGTVETTTYARAYPLKKRNAATELLLDNGQTLAIGGLIKQKSEEDIIKTPWLGDVPILGMFFRKKVSKVGGGTGERGNVELFITLTPTIVSKDKGAALSKEVKITSLATTSKKQEPTEPTDPVSRYSRLVQKRILENLVYPVVAKEAGLQGAVKLSLHLSYQGELLDASVKDSSGYKILDESALSMAKSIGAYPPFPSSIDQNDLWIDIPIVYKLD